jgi:hypothetical protein
VHGARAQQHQPCHKQQHQRQTQPGRHPRDPLMRSARPMAFVSPFIL